MTEDTASGGQARRPWHVWAVGVLSFVWNLGGVIDYTLTKTRNADYLANFTPEQLAYFDSFSFGMNTAWAFGVWGASLGSVILLIKPRLALPVFTVSLLGLAVSTVFQSASDKPAGLDGPGMAAFTIAIWVVAIALVLYAWWIRRRYPAL